MLAYRRGVVAIIVGPGGRVLVGERSDSAGHWQLPQGGIDKGETEEQALAREVHEEVGVKNLKVLGRTSNYIQTDWPADLFLSKKKQKYKGQEHIYFVLDGSGVEPENLAATEEFARFKWNSLQALLAEVVPWRQAAYRKAFTELKGTCFLL